MVRWHYDKKIVETPVEDLNEENLEPLTLTKETIYLGPTHCIVTFLDEGREPQEEYKATVNLNRTDGDRWSKAGGRKWSLKKVIDLMRQELELTKEERRMFWETYAEMRNGSFI